MRRLTILSALLCFAFITTGAGAQEARTGDPLFAATMDDASGKSVALERYRGKPLLVNFWARWCGPCREEIPLLIKLRPAMQARDGEVLGIAIDDKAEAVREFARAYDMDYPILVAREQGIPLMRTLGDVKAGLPFTLAIDRRGKIVYTKLGMMRQSDFDAAMQAALQP